MSNFKFTHFSFQNSKRNFPQKKEKKTLKNKNKDL